MNQCPIQCNYKGVGSLTAEIGPIFGRKLKVRFTFCVVYI